MPQSEWDKVKHLTKLKNDWFRALHIYNKTNSKSFCIPRRGTQPYLRVKDIEARIKQGRLSQANG